MTDLFVNITALITKQIILVAEFKIKGEKLKI